MKYILLPFLILTSQLFSQNFDMGPIWEDRNFGFERTLCIECSLDRIDEMTIYTPPVVRDMIKRELLLIRFNIGYPITEEEFDFLISD